MIAIEFIIGHPQIVSTQEWHERNSHLLEWAYALLILAPWEQSNESEWILNNVANEVFTKDSWKLLKQYCRILYELKYLRGSAQLISSSQGIFRELHWWSTFERYQHRSESSIKNEPVQSDLSSQLQVDVYQGDSRRSALALAKQLGSVGTQTNWYETHFCAYWRFIA